MQSSDFTVIVEMIDGTRIELGGGDEFFVTPAEGNTAATLDDSVLELVKALKSAEREVTG